MTITGKIVILCLIAIAKCLGIGEFGKKCGPNSEGECTLVASCPEATAKIWSGQPHGLDICGFHDKFEIVCCKRESGSQTQVRKSVAACEKYSKTYSTKSLPSITDEYVSLGELPHFAAIGLDGYEEGEFQWGQCGGALISETFVLTVAHCAVRVDQKFPTMVRLGKVDLIGDKDNVTAQDIPISDIIIHPDYQHLTKHNDIALLRLSKPATFSKNVNAICLDIKNELPSEFITASWGLIKSEETSKLLKRAFLKTYALDKCNQTFSNPGWGIIDSQLCILGTPEIPRQGDSG
ncbi:Trypsin, partial [Oryctes borbonicus]